MVETSDVESRELLNVLTRDAADEIRQHEQEILGVRRALGGRSNQYQRERRKAIRVWIRASTHHRE